MDQDSALIAALDQGALLVYVPTPIVIIKLYLNILIDHVIILYLNVDTLNETNAPEVTVMVPQWTI
mgnify:CR=1 FL=1